MIKIAAEEISEVDRTSFFTQWWVSFSVATISISETRAKQIDGAFRINSERGRRIGKKVLLIKVSGVTNRQ